MYLTKDLNHTLKHIKGEGNLITRLEHKHYKCKTYRVKQVPPIYERRRKENI